MTTKQVIARLLTLTLMAALCVAAPAGAKTTGLFEVLRMSGNSAFSLPSDGKIVVTDLRTGKQRKIAAPAGVSWHKIDAKVNSHAVAVVTGADTTKLQLWIAGLGIKPRVLAEVDRPVSGCGASNQIKPLQIDSKDLVTALFTHYASDGDYSCVPTSGAVELRRYKPDGSFVTLSLPDYELDAIAWRPDSVVMRGDDLFVPPPFTGSGDASVFNLKSGFIVWQDKLPYSGGFSMPAPGVILSQSSYVNGHTSRVYVTDFKRSLVRTITVNHPTPGMPCGDKWVHVGPRQIEVYNFHGRRLLTRKIKSPDSYSDKPDCSDNWIFAPRSRNAWKWNRRLLRAELINISRLH